MGLKVTNNAFGTLNAGINSSATTIVLASGQGARFPSLGAGDYFYATLIDTSNNLEIVKVTARSTDTMTVVRGQDSTTARAYSTNDRFELRPTAVMLNEIITKAEGALPLTGGTLSGSLKAQVFGNAEISAQYGTGLEAKLGAYAAETTLYLPSPSVDFRLRARPGAADTLAIMAKYSGTERDGFVIDYLGRITTPLRPAFRAQKNNSQTLNGSTNADIKVEYNSISFNVGSHYDAGNDRFTAPVAGIYYFSAFFMFSSPSTDYGYTFIRLLKNGSDAVESEIMMPRPSGGQFASVAVNMPVYLAANDYMEVWTRQVGGTNLTIRDGFGVFSGFLLG